MILKVGPSRQLSGSSTLEHGLSVGSLIGRYLVNISNEPIYPSAAALHRHDDYPRVTCTTVVDRKAYAHQIGMLLAPSPSPSPLHHSCYGGVASRHRPGLQTQTDLRSQTNHVYPDRRALFSGMRLPLYLIWPRGVCLCLFQAKLNASGIVFHWSAD